MRFLGLALLPILWALVLAIAVLAIPDEATRAGLLHVEVDVVKALGAVGLIAAAMSFDPGDYLRRAWLFGAANYLLLFARELVNGHDGPLLGLSNGLWQALLVTAANVSGVAFVAMLARAWAVSGLEHPSSKLSPRALLLLAAVVALAVTGWPMLHDTQDLMQGNAAGLLYLASDLGDAIAFTLAAPVMMTAFALRGGVLRWPWAMLTACYLAWLVNDLATPLVSVMHLTNLQGDLLKEVTRALGCTFAFSAGLSQRFAMTAEHAVSADPPASG
jgi:hypothetical protein